MIPADIVQKASAYVRRLFSEADTKLLHFHNYEHTEEVVQHAIEIAQKEGLGQDELQIVQVAAWFHDIGHLNGAMQDHELRSVEAVKKFFAEESIEEAQFIQRVVDCIMATRMPQAPTDKLGEIMCDADVYHFGTPQFRKTNKRVRKELKARGYPAMANNWPQRSLRMLQSQHFFTPYSRQKLEQGKAENIRWLQQKIAEKEKTTEAIPEEPASQIKLGGKEVPETKLQEVSTTKNVKESAAREPSKEERQEQKASQSLLSRGIQTMLRLGSSNHLDLSRMADGKANILISVNSIIISVILSVLIGRLDSDPYLLIPTILFLTSSVITVILAILATRPKLTEGKFTRESIQRKEVNLIFFGNFYKSSLEEYTWAMNELMNDKDYLYDTLVKDIYFLGVVLGRKYMLLRWAYNVFMLGLIIAVTSFSIAIALNMPSGHTTVINASGAPL
jgi:predicted metal-dependent HD superfamily phosphohydrolase